MTVAHLDKSVAFVFVCDTGLDGSEAAKDCAQFGFVAVGAADKECSAENLDVARRNSVVHVCPFGVDALRGKTLVCLGCTGRRRSALAIVAAATAATASAATAIRVGGMILSRLGKRSVISAIDWTCTAARVVIVVVASWFW